MSMIPLIDAGIERYAEDHSSEEPELLRKLAEETLRLPGAQMLTGRLEGRLLRLLVLLIGAKRVLEIGMFTGYSALSMASALPEDGELITCDVDPEVEAVARRYFAQSPDGRKITIRMGPALDTLASLEGLFDMAFVDADKEKYPEYLEMLVETHPAWRTIGGRQRALERPSLVSRRRGDSGDRPVESDDPRRPALGQCASYGSRRGPHRAPLLGGTMPSRGR